MSSGMDSPKPGSIERRLVPAVRLILATSALLIGFFVPLSPERHVAVFTVVLILYIGYSSLIYALALRRSPLMQFVGRWVPWVDVGGYAFLIGLSGGARSVLSLGLFFAILVASLRRGYASGLRVTVASAFLFAAGNFLGLPNSDLDNFWFSLICLVALGYLMARLGGLAISQERQLALLRELTSLSNPRFGIDHAIGSFMERLRAFYDSDACLFVVYDPATGEHSLRRAHVADPKSATRAEPIQERLARLLQALPAEQAIVYTAKPRMSLNLGKSHCASRGQAFLESEGNEVLTGLKVRSFIAVPIHSCSKASRVLYLFSRRQRVFRDSDVRFLHELIDHVIPLIDTVGLVDRLASTAGEEERTRIGRDLHDTTIQHYIGLQLGLVAIRTKLAMGTHNVKEDIEHLIDITNLGIADLRSYIDRLRGVDNPAGSLVPALQRFATKFADANGIAVEIDAKEDIPIGDRLAAELFQIVAEGLSNVRRHTQARRARARLRRDDRHIMLRIENDNPNGQLPLPFTPRSITDRAMALGGHAHVEALGQAGTAVVIMIPL
jgi:signal transduction histidine kinase